MTDAERALWARLRRKQVHSVQFYTQKTIGNYIVDLYAPKARLVVELDGSQHMEKEHATADFQVTALCQLDFAGRIYSYFPMHGPNQ